MSVTGNMDDSGSRFSGAVRGDVAASPTQVPRPDVGPQVTHRAETPVGKIAQLLQDRGVRAVLCRDRQQVGLVGPAGAEGVSIRSAI